MLTGKDCFSGYLIPSILVHSLDYLLFFLSLIELIIHSKADFFIFENNRIIQN
jgi:hypothetical protein